MRAEPMEISLLSTLQAGSSGSRESLVAAMNGVVDDPCLVDRNAHLMLRTARLARAEVCRAPGVGHVVKTRAGTCCQQRNNYNHDCDSHARHSGIYSCECGFCKAPPALCGRPCGAVHILRRPEGCGARVAPHALYVSFVGLRQRAHMT